MKKLEKDIKKHLVERGWDTLRPADLAKSIMIEGAELLELFQWENKELEEIKKDKKKLAEISKELADVFIYAFDLSVSLGLDTEKLIRAKLAQVAKKYPARLMRRSAKQGAGSEADSIYWKIKKEHRKKGK